MASRRSTTHAIIALHGVSLTVRRGEILAVLGANGAGKSTTLRSISNLLQAERGQITAGSIRFEGRDVLRTSPRRARQTGPRAGAGRSALLPIADGRGESRHRRRSPRVGTRRDHPGPGARLRDLSPAEGEAKDGRRPHLRRGAANDCDRARANVTASPSRSRRISRSCRHWS